MGPRVACCQLDSISSHDSSKAFGFIGLPVEACEHDFGR